jgi:hypothetical protein
MIIEWIIRGFAGPLSRCLGLFLMISGLLFSSGYAGEVNDKEVTAQIPKESVQAVGNNGKGVPAGKTEAQLLEKIDELQKRIERLERMLEGTKKAGVSPAPAPLPEKRPGEGPQTGSMAESAPPQSTAIHEQLLKEEMGQVRGVIQWQGKPLVDGSVRIELERYTGFSLTSVKKIFAGEEGGSVDQGLSLSTRTDSQGHYAFAKVPPGSYRLYWMPDFKTGWVHRLREKPDFEVFSGKVTVQNIPEKPSVLKLKEKK